MVIDTEKATSCKEKDKAYAEEEYLLELAEYNSSEKPSWGNRGPRGNQPLEWLTPTEMSTSHIRAVLTTQALSTKHWKAFINELCWRIECL